MVFVIGKKIIIDSEKTMWYISFVAWGIGIAGRTVINVQNAHMKTFADCEDELNE